MKRVPKNGRLVVLLVLVVLAAILSYSEIVDNSSNDGHSTGTQVENNLLVHFIDVGQGDSIYLDLPNGQNMLIDAGDNGYGDLVVDYLNNLGVTQIDYLIATHPHADHIGGMSIVIDKMNVKKIYMPDVTTTTQTFERLLTSIENKELQISIAERGKEILKNEYLRAVFIAPAVKSDDLNNMSAVLRLEFDEISFLFMGDAEKESELEILNNWNELKADVIKIGHHGSGTSSTKSFIKNVNPKYAIISCGKDNKYGHPTDVTLKILKDFGINVYRTDTQGSIVLSSDGKSIDKVNSK